MIKILIFFVKINHKSACECVKLKFKNKKQFFGKINEKFFILKFHGKI
jgi:hypothetical protein